MTTKFNCKKCKTKNIINLKLHLRKHHHEIYEKNYEKAWKNQKLTYLEKLFEFDKLELENFEAVK